MNKKCAICWIFIAVCIGGLGWAGYWSTATTVQLLDSIENIQEQQEIMDNNIEAVECWGLLFNGFIDPESPAGINILNGTQAYNAARIAYDDAVEEMKTDFITLGYNALIIFISTITIIFSSIAIRKNR